jgi:hypothetical protein
MRAQFYTKTLAIFLLALSAGKLHAQSDMIAYINEIPHTATFTSSEEHVAVSDFSFAPTTNIAKINVRTVNPLKLRVFFYNITGELAKEEYVNLNSGSNELNLDISNLLKGIYIVQFYSKEGSAIRKIVKAD